MEKYKNSPYGPDEVPKAAPTLCRLGEIHLKKGNFEKANIRFLQAIEQNSNCATAYHGMGIILQHEKKFSRAIACYQKAKELEPFALKHLVKIGLAYREIGRLKEAVNFLQKAISINKGVGSVYFLLGQVYYDLSRFTDAVSCFQKTIELNPVHMGAYVGLADCYMVFRQPTRVMEVYYKALKLDPESAIVLNNLGAAFMETGEVETAIRYFKQSIHFDPHLAEAYINIGSLYRDNGEMKKSIRFLERAIQLNPEAAEAHYNLSLSYLYIYDFPKGWEEYEWRFRTPLLDLQNHLLADESYWDGGPLNGRTILIRDEQGVGDTLQFIRFLPLVKRLGGIVLFETEKPLSGLLTHFNGIDRFIDRRKEELSEIHFDCYIPLMSLPRILQAGIEYKHNTVPYLYADPQGVRKWAKRISAEPGIRIGINWQGNPDYVSDKSRSIPFHHFHSLCRMKGISVFSLQKYYGLEQLENLPPHVRIINMGPDLDEECRAFVDTAAVIESLDLIITSDSAISHLAGSLGKKVWLLLPFVPDWRWGISGENTHWYPNMRLFRQISPGDWSELFSRVANALTEFVSSR
ncbi:MAG: glycosyltransferase family protein [Desulfobacteraceae bacterium]|nr:glycosyltransferase family protein [Desulfobacteraceae bacterium]